MLEEAKILLLIVPELRRWRRDYQNAVGVTAIGHAGDRIINRKVDQVIRGLLLQKERIFISFDSTGSGEKDQQR